MLHLVIGEKNILRNTIKFTQDLKNEVDELVQQHLQQLAVGMNDLNLGTNQASITDGKDDSDDLGELLVKDTPSGAEQQPVISKEPDCEETSKDILVDTQCTSNETQLPTSEVAAPVNETVSPAEQPAGITETPNDQCA